MQENIETTNTQIENTAVKAVPVQKQERIETLDILRGFALLGIFLIHMPAWFGTPAIYLMVLGESMWTNIWDTTVASFIDLFFLGKFYTIFSFLFGLGFVIFYERAKARASKPVLLFYKRIFILLIIGLLHAFFIWYGDILVSYALLALLLPAFFNRKSKTYIKWAIVLFSLFLLFFGLVALATGMATRMGLVNEAEVMANVLPMIEQMRSGIESSFQAYRYGAFADIMAQRRADVLLGYSQIWALFFMIFPLFLLGIYVGKKGILQNIEANMGFIKKAWKWGLIIGLPMSIVKFIAGNQMNHLLPDIFSFLYYAGSILGDTGMSIFYMTSIILLCQNAKWLLRLKPFGYVGRMALSNYLLQSIIGTLIFYNYGLGLYGQIAPAFGMALALVIFAMQIFISKWWLGRYQFGPMEWTWKSLTYGKRFKNKVQN